MGLELTEWEVVFLLVAAALGGGAHSALGFGAAFTTAPAIALIAPGLLPGTVIVAIIPISATMLVRDRTTVDTRAVVRITLGRLPGIAVGGAIVALLDARVLTVLIAALLLIAVASAASGWHIEVTPGRQAIAGAASGLTGTTAALSGPPLALLYRGESARRLRPTLSAVWLIGNPLMLGVLWWAGALTAAQVTAGLLLGAAMIGGLLLMAPAVRRMPDLVVQRTILLWATVGAIGALVRTLIV